MNKKIEVAFVLALLVLVSPVWVESDGYRFIAILLALIGMFLYSKAVEKPPMPVMGKVGALWAAFVVGYYIYVKLTHPDATGGSAEGIYLFPLLYPSIGYFLYVYRNAFDKIIWAFMIVSFCLLLASISPLDVIEKPLGTRIPILFHKNTIHASLGAAFILIASVFFFIWAWKLRPKRVRLAGLFLAASNVIMCLIGIYGSSSKGVWVSVGVLIFCWAIFSLVLPIRRIFKVAIAGIAICIGVGVFFFLPHITNEYVAGNIAGVLKIVQNVGSMDQFSMEALKATIDQSELPKNMTVRFHLWMKAVQIWLMNPVFGMGIYWENIWVQQSDDYNKFTLVHNGYLSVAMRFGLVGLLYYGALFIWVTRQIRICADRGIIDRLAYYFSFSILSLFLISILTNSNHRLAIGESFMIAFGAFGFACHYLCQKQNDKT
ncbi:MAG: O-antigen ligase family protein [Rhizobiaceae bacterium]|nr:O-antigen ligase family protein [Rhizobiaceae bacterium]